VQRSKTLPKDAATFLADCLARDGYMLTQHNRDDVAAELLGIDAAAIHTAITDLAHRQRQPRPGNRTGAGAGGTGSPLMCRV
jgi:hypothetical protein